jgi:hypothetical protein
MDQGLDTVIIVYLTESPLPHFPLPIPAAIVLNGKAQNLSHEYFDTFGTFGKFRGRHGKSAES